MDMRNPWFVPKMYVAADLSYIGRTLYEPCPDMRLNSDVTRDPLELTTVRYAWLAVSVTNVEGKPELPGELSRYRTGWVVLRTLYALPLARETPYTLLLAVATNTELEELCWNWYFDGMYGAFRDTGDAKVLFHTIEPEAAEYSRVWFPTDTTTAVPLSLVKYEP